MVIKIKWVIALVIFMFCALSNAHQHNIKKHTNKKQQSCLTYDIACAKTVTVATHPDGDIWRVFSLNKQMYYSISRDQGISFSKAVHIKAINEEISSRGENRPKIAFSKQGNIYLSWARPGKKKYTGDIRFSFSNNQGESFSKPITVNNDNLITSHSFNEMIVTDKGQLILVWLDGRDKFKAKSSGKQFNGSSVYLASAQFKHNGQVSFTNKQLAQSTCVCCRLTLSQTDEQQVSIMYRDIFGDNIRDFSLVSFDLANNRVINKHRVTFDEWFINGCPHQGAGISQSDQRLHLTWFNQGIKGKGIFYGFTDNLGKNISQPIKVGNTARQSMHPNLISKADRVDLVWLEFNGSEHELWHQKSINNGQSFTAPKMLSTAKTGADRPFLFTTKNGFNYVSWHKPKQGHWVQKL